MTAIDAEYGRGDGNIFVTHGVAEWNGQRAEISEEPGFKNWKCLSTALYTLVRKYPQADHFRYR